MGGSPGGRNHHGDGVQLMPLRPCLDCGRLVDGATRCASCRRDVEQRRGSRQERGYDAEYEAAKLEPAFVNATHCETCDRPFTEDNPKTAGHSTALRRGGKGSPIFPQCQDCNYGWRRTDT